jgi:hypothetical protein
MNVGDLIRINKRKRGQTNVAISATATSSRSQGIISITDIKKDMLVIIIEICITQLWPCRDFKVIMSDGRLAFVWEKDSVVISD